MKRTYKRGLAAGLVLIILLVTLAGCQIGSDGTESGIAPGDTSEPEEMEMETGDEAVIEVPEPIIDNTEDTTEPLDFGVELTGEYVQLSAKAEENYVSSYPVGFYTVDDGVIVVHAQDNYEYTDLTFQKIDTETGKQLLSVKFSAPGVYRYSMDVRGQDYGAYDFIVLTTDGLYLFDFEDLEKQPEYVVFEIEDRSNMGTLTITDSYGGMYSLMNEMYDVYYPEENIVFASDEGIFVTDYTFQNAQKIVDQPGKKAWFGNMDDALAEKVEELEEIDLTATYDTVYANPRFIADGTKVVVELNNFELGLGVMGIAIIDLETSEVDEINYYDKDSIIGRLSDWDEIDKVVFNLYKYVDQDTVSLFSTVISESASRRFDLLYDVNDQSITRKILSPSGYTTDYNTLMINDSYRGESGKLTFYDLINGVYFSEGVYMSNALNEPSAINSDYAIAKVWETGGNDGEEEAVTDDVEQAIIHILTPIPTN